MNVKHKLCPCHGLIRTHGDFVAYVLIVGASKGIGFEAVNFELTCGHTVRAPAQSVHKINLADPILEKRKGDALNRKPLG